MKGHVDPRFPAGDARPGAVRPGLRRRRGKARQRPARRQRKLRHRRAAASAGRRRRGKDRGARRDVPKRATSRSPSPAAFRSRSASATGRQASAAEDTPRAGCGRSRTTRVPTAPKSLLARHLNNDLQVFIVKWFPAARRLRFDRTAAKKQMRWHLLRVTMERPWRRRRSGPLLVPARCPESSVPVSSRAPRGKSTARLQSLIVRGRPARSARRPTVGSGT